MPPQILYEQLSKQGLATRNFKQNDQEYIFYYARKNQRETKLTIPINSKRSHSCWLEIQGRAKDETDRQIEGNAGKIIKRNVPENGLACSSLLCASAQKGVLLADDLYELPIIDLPGATLSLYASASLSSSKLNVFACLRQRAGMV